MKLLPITYSASALKAIALLAAILEGVVVHDKKYKYDIDDDGILDEGMVAVTTGNLM